MGEDIHQPGNFGMVLIRAKTWENFPACLKTLQEYDNLRKEAFDVSSKFMLISRQT